MQHLLNLSRRGGYHPPVRYPFYHIFQRIIFDVLPDFVIILLIPNPVVIKGLLPNGFPYLLGNQTLKLLYYTGDRRGELCLPVLVGIDPNDHVNMVGHNTIFVNRYGIVHSA